MKIGLVLSSMDYPLGNHFLSAYHKKTLTEKAKELYLSQTLLFQNRRRELNPSSRFQLKAFNLTMQNSNVEN
ncbi:MAG: hypothetical protein AB7U29_11230 [Desulfobulbus sp.]